MQFVEVGVGAMLGLDVVAAPADFDAVATAGGSPTTPAGARAPTSELGSPTLASSLADESTPIKQSEAERVFKAQRVLSVRGGGGECGAVCVRR